MLAGVSQEEFMSNLAHYAKYHRHFKKAALTALSGSVKKHVFKPSGKVIYSVVGKSGDEFVDPEKPFCSCSHFFFRVTTGQDEYCYHLLAYKMALETKTVDEIHFRDEEYEPFVQILVHDILDGLKDKGDKATKLRLNARPR